MGWNRQIGLGGLRGAGRNCSGIGWLFLVFSSRVNYSEVIVKARSININLQTMSKKGALWFVGAGALVLILGGIVLAFTLKPNKEYIQNIEEKPEVKGTLAEQNSYTVSKELARKVANCQLLELQKEFSEWKQAHLGDGVSFNDFNREQSAIFFPVKVGDDQSGYITISGSTRFFPLIEVGGPGANNPLFRINASRDSCIKKINVSTEEVSAVDTTLIYIMSQDYILEVSFKEKHCYISLVSGFLYDEDRLNELQNLRQNKALEISGRAQSAWQNIIRSQCN